MESTYTDVLAYSRNWNNKLSCDVFTAFRPYDPDKFTIGKPFRIVLSGKYLKLAVIVDVQVMTLSQVTDWIARLDTGLSQQEFVKTVKAMYQNNNLDYDSQPWCWLLMHTVKN